jgi:hypothetical protein
MNLARRLGPPLISGDLHGLWLYVLAPLIRSSARRAQYQFIQAETAAV